MSRINGSRIRGSCWSSRCVTCRGRSCSSSVASWTIAWTCNRSWWGIGSARTLIEPLERVNASLLVITEVRLATAISHDRFPISHRIFGPTLVVFIGIVVREYEWAICCSRAIRDCTNSTDGRQLRRWAGNRRAQISISKSTVATTFHCPIALTIVENV